MAYINCAAGIVDNIAKDCKNPIVGGYTGRGILIDLSDNPTIVRDAQNPRIVNSITIKSGKKVSVIDNVFTQQPFNGSNTQSNADDGMIKNRKTFTFQVPRRGAQASKEIVEPSYQNPMGYLVILEKKDRVGDGSYEILGLEEGLQANADGIVRNEYENGGCVMVTMSCNENAFENVLFNVSYEQTFNDFEALMASAW